GALGPHKPVIRIRRDILAVHANLQSGHVAVDTAADSVNVDRLDIVTHADILGGDVRPVLPQSIAELVKNPEVSLWIGLYCFRAEHVRAARREIEISDTKGRDAQWNFDIDLKILARITENRTHEIDPRSHGSPVNQQPQTRRIRRKTHPLGF